VVSREVHDLVCGAIDEIDRFIGGAVPIDQIATALKTHLDACAEAGVDGVVLSDVRTLQSELEYASAVWQETGNDDRRQLESAAAYAAARQMRVVLSDFVATFDCPVCGYPGLPDEPWRVGVEYDSPSEDICPSCGTQFGYDDIADDRAERLANHRELRRKWIEAGRPWKHPGSEPTPSELGWDPSSETA
jgi:predicted RNA-binding Zn-ribbon protein involved in translation (DUF1610 family)